MNTLIEKNFVNQSIKYLVQKQMFCKNTGEILDCLTCIVVEIYKDGKMVQTWAMSPKCESLIEAGNKKVEALGATVKVLRWQK